MDNISEDNNLDLAASEGPVLSTTQGPVLSAAEGPVLSAAEGEFTTFNQNSYLPDPLDTEHEITAAPEYPELTTVPTPVELAPVLEEATVLPQAPLESSTQPKTEAALSTQQLAMIKNLLAAIEDNTRQIKNILEPYSSSLPDIKLKLNHNSTSADKDLDSEIIEGAFNGQAMIGPDGHEYAVPANYASKSRLVEGDTLKLIITKSGAFIFKQIEPVDRRRVTGVLEETETGDFFVMAEDRRWRVLPASVTYYKGESGDQAVIVIPKLGLSKWAAVENIIKR